MKSMFVESESGMQKVYESMLLEPKHLSIFSNDLAIRIVEELAKQPSCAMDIAKALKQHEQKIYYHLRKMKKAGIIRQSGTEMRYGMIAKMFELVSPVVATKLSENISTTNEDLKVLDPNMKRFLEPFIKGGRLNAKIVVGDPYPHGKHDQGGLDALHAIDVAVLLGNFTKDIAMPCCVTDIRISNDDIATNNLILVGGPRGNVVVDKLNSDMPIYFDENNEFNIVSNLSESVYTDDLSGVVIKADNPLNKKNKVLLLAGKRTRGTHAAVIAFTKYVNEIMKGNVYDKSVIAKVVHGFDKDGDGTIDDVKFRE